MRYIYKGKIFSVLLVLIISISASAGQLSSNYDYYNPLDLKLEFNLNSGYTSNLLADSSNVEDSYTTSSIRLKFYPASSMEVILFGDYTYYNRQFNLSSLSKGLTFTFVPTKKNSRFSAYLSGGFSGQTYRDELNSYDNNNFNLITTFGYRIGRTLSFRTGMLIESSSYLRTDAPDKDSYEIFAGTNFTFLGSNSLDIEGGYTSMNLSSIPDTTGWLVRDLDSYHFKGKLYSYYISPRFSRPIGSKFGLNLTYHHRKFSNGEHSVVLGSALNFISPWGNIYEGQSCTFSLKTIIVPKMIISSGFGYWKKTFMKTMVVTDLYPVRYAENRVDEQNRFFLILERPIFFKSGAILKPKLQIDYSNNNTTSISMFGLYDYSSQSVNASLNYQF